MEFLRIWWIFVNSVKLVFSRTEHWLTRKLIQKAAISDTTFFLKILTKTNLVCFWNWRMYFRIRLLFLRVGCDKLTKARFSIHLNFNIYWCKFGIFYEKKIIYAYKIELMWIIESCVHERLWFVKIPFYKSKNRSGSKKASQHPQLFNNLTESSITLKSIRKSISSKNSNKKAIQDTKTFQFLSKCSKWRNSPWIQIELDLQNLEVLILLKLSSYTSHKNYAKLSWQKHNEAIEQLSNWFN